MINYVIVSVRATRIQRGVISSVSQFAAQGTTFPTGVHYSPHIISLNSIAVLLFSPYSLPSNSTKRLQYC